MSTATDRLALYLAAEAEILKAEEVSLRGGGGGAERTLRMSRLLEVRQGIKDLQREIAAENANSAGTGGLGFSVANLSGC
jgi:hypothetical protein